MGLSCIPSLQSSTHFLPIVSLPRNSCLEAYSIRYQELAVFPEDTDIPLATLQFFWNVTDDLKSWETEDLCTHLHHLSLLLTCDLRKGTIRLHDVLRSYLIQRAGPHLPALHARLLDLYQQALGLTRWADLPRSEEYLWHHLILHLCQAGRKDALQATLTDLDYLIKKALYVGVSALEADILLARTFQQTDAVASALFESLHRSIVRISHLLRQVQTPAEIGGLLLSYLGFQPLFAVQRTILERKLPRPLLTAWHPLLGRVSAALLRTLHGHTSGVYDCAISPDGRFIVSASEDFTLKLWDARTGQCLLTFPVDEELSGCVLHPDGEHLVACGVQGVYFLRLVV